MNAPAQRLVRGTDIEPPSSTRHAIVRAAATVGPLGVAAALTISAVSLMATFHALVPLASSASVAVLVAAALVDVVERRLPNVIVALGAGIFVLGLALPGAPTISNGMVTNVGGGIVLLAGPLLAMHLTSPTAMGFGDVKLAAVLGAAVGVVHWQLAVVTLALAAGTTAAVALVRRLRHVAFGPGLVAAAAVGLAAHPLLLSASLLDSTTNIGLLS